MKTRKIVVLADIESVRVPFSSFEKALKQVSKNGEITSCKFYGYSAKRTKDYAEFIADNNYDALTALPGKRKGNLDLRQVIDAVEVAQYPNIGGFFIMYGKGNIKPLVSYLKGLGMEVYAGVIEPDDNSANCNETIILEEGLLYTQRPRATKAKAKKAEKPAPAPKTAPANSEEDDIIAKLAALLGD